MRLKLACLPLVCGLAFPAVAAGKPDQIKRGAYLTVTMGCHDCHTPLKMGPKGPEPDMSRMLTGHDASVTMPPPPALEKGPWGWVGSLTMTAFSGPWGVSYSANLTPDDETGIGKWSEKSFLEAMRSGKHQGKGRPILPPMPWQGIGKATDGDLKAIYAYLKSLKPVRNRVPEPVEPAAAAK